MTNLTRLGKTLKVQTPIKTTYLPFGTFRISYDPLTLEATIYSVDTAAIVYDGVISDLYDVANSLAFTVPTLEVFITSFNFGGSGGGGTITDVTATYPLKSSGGSTPNISIETQPDGIYGINFSTGIASLVSTGNIYTSDGVINSTRLVDMVDVITTFKANGVLDGFISDIKFNSIGDGLYSGGSISVGLGLGALNPNEYTSVLDMIGEEGIISFKTSTGSSKKETFLLTNRNTTITAHNSNEVESIQLTLDGHDTPYPTASIFDNRVIKKGIQLMGFGETDPDGIGVVFTSLVNNSLVPKQYVDNLVSTIGQSFSEQTHITGNTVTITDTTTILYIDPVSTLASLTITLPETPVNGQEVKVSFGGTLTTGAVVTTLSIVGNTGHTVLSTPTTPISGVGYTLKFQSSTNLWRIF